MGKNSVTSKQEDACWKAHRRDEAVKAAAVRKQMDRMFEQHDAEMRVDELAANLPEYREEAITLPDHKSAARKRRETANASKKSTVTKAKKARAEYEAKLDYARKKGKRLPKTAPNRVLGLEKRAAKIKNA